MFSNDTTADPKYSLLFDRQRGTTNYLGNLSPAASSVDSSDMKMNSPLSSVMSPTDLILNSEMMLMDDVAELTSMPFLEVTEQPVEKFRFRYKSEMVGTHGSLNGANSDKIRKNTFPTVQIHNFGGHAIIRCSLYQIKKEEPHAHRLVIRAGSGEKDDPHDLEVNPERGYTAVFQGMGIIHTAKKHLASELVKKKSRLMKEEIARSGFYRNLTQLEEAEINRQAEAESKCINLNTVRLRFEAFSADQNGILMPICSPVYSHGINNLKSALTGELKIVRMDHTTTSCVGGQEIFILVEKVTKNNIKVRFFECDEDDNEIWSDYGKFSHIDVHHQYAIVFKAPPYKDQNIDSNVDVCIELVRPSDGARSEPRAFRYKPSEKAGRKRQRYSESLSSGELPTTINNLSFGSSVSLSDSMLRDPQFFEQLENVNSDEFARVFNEVSSHYQQTLTTDGTCEPIPPIQKYDPETEKLAKKVVSDLSIQLKQNPKPETVEILVKNLFHHMYTADGNNALHTAILCEQYQHLQYILVLLSKMKELKIVDIKNNAGETALHIAVKINNPTVVNLLLPVGADANLVDEAGNTPLHLAILDNRNLEDYKALVKVSELNTENDDGYTPLHLAVQKNNVNSVKILVEANADVNYKHRSNGNTVLHLAVEEKSPEIIKYLLSSTNARLDEENYTRTTPVHMAKLLADSEGDAAEKIFEIISNYVKDKGFETLMIKNEPEDEDSNSDSEILIKSEPVSPRNMEIDQEPDTQMLETLKEMEFSDDCIKQLSEILDGTDTLQSLAKVIEFDVISVSLKTISTKMVLNYANVTGIYVYDIRQILVDLHAKNAVRIIDNLLL